MAVKQLDLPSLILGLLMSGGSSAAGMMGGFAAQPATGEGASSGGSAARNLSPAARAILNSRGANGKGGLNAAAEGAITGGAGGKVPVPMEQQPNPQNYLDYKVINIPGAAQYNAGLNRGVNPLVYDQQTEEAHNAALNAYMGMPRIPEATALAMGRTDERSLPSFWDDAALRQDVHPTSSAISHIRITPDNRIEVQWGNFPKTYSYRGGPTRAAAAKEAAQLVQSNSLGRTLAPSLRSAWRQAHYDTRFNGVGRSKY